MTAQDIRDAVAAGDYPGAQARFAEYARSLPLTDAARAELADLLEWTRTTLLCARAHEQERLRTLRDELHVLETYAR